MPDIAIIGGALMGSSAAYHLLARDPSLDVAVIEKDPSYEWAASARSNAMIRILFSQPENLLMSRYGQEFFTDFSNLMEVGGDRPPLDYTRGGLLIIANDADQAEDVRINADFQRSLDCEVEVLAPEEITRRWPALNGADIYNAAYSADAGWIDPHGALTGLRKKARDMGARFLEAEVVDFARDGQGIDTAILAAGSSTQPAPGRARFAAGPVSRSPWCLCRAWSTTSKQRIRHRNCPTSATASASVSGARGAALSPVSPTSVLPARSHSKSTTIGSRNGSGPASPTASPPSNG